MYDNYKYKCQYGYKCWYEYGYHESLNTNTNITRTGNSNGNSNVEMRQTNHLPKNEFQAGLESRRAL